MTHQRVCYLSLVKCYGHVDSVTLKSCLKIVARIRKTGIDALIAQSRTQKRARRNGKNRTADYANLYRTRDNHNGAITSFLEDDC